MSKRDGWLRERRVAKREMEGKDRDGWHREMDGNERDG
jgi:hypothetical protein